MKEEMPYSVNLRFPPNVFRQANGVAFTKIIERVRELMPERGESQVVEVSDERRAQRGCVRGGNFVDF